VEFFFEVLMTKYIGTMTIENITENDDGTCTIDFLVPKELQESIKTQQGWEEWSKEKFEALVIDALRRGAEEANLDGNSN
jgi:hypothetical protein